MVNTANLLNALRQLHLLEPAQLEELTAKFQGQPAEPRTLARYLLERDWLTPYQANQLLQGRGPDLLLGSYVLLERLGEGGMGTVFKARNWKLGRIVALKLIRKERIASPDAVRRFQREVRAAAQLDHPNIVRAHDADQVGGTHFLVMDYIEGTDLAELVKKKGPLPIDWACECVRQVAVGLQHAHERSLVHRDIKPSNLLLQETRSGPVVKILDMGLARLEPGADGGSLSTLTHSGMIMGTPDFLAPEQARRSRNADIRSDLYSLGCTLYFLLTGRVPFPGHGVTDKLLKHQLDEAEPVERLRPDVPPGIAALVRKLMSKKPEHRYQTPAELVEVLARGGELASAAPLPDAPLASPSVPSETVTDVTNSTTDPSVLGPAPRKRFLPWLLGGGVVLLAGLGLVGFLLYSPRPETPAQTKPDPLAPVVFPVEASQPWQDTGVDVVEGQSVTVTPEGTWQKGEQECSARGLEKALRDRNVMQGAPSLCLLVRVGNEPIPTPLAEKQAYRPRRSGRLFLQANDLDLEDNRGSLQVTIEGGLNTGEVSPPPGLLSIQALDRDLKRILSRASSPEAVPEQVREEALEFCTRNLGTPQALRAASVLPKFPLTNSIGMKLMPIAPGKFLMGSPVSEPGRQISEDQHEVVLTRPFFIGAHEVTVGQFRKFVEQTKYKTEAEKGNGAMRPSPTGGAWVYDPQVTWQKPGFEQTDDHPVVCVSWNDASAFCKWLSQKEGKRYELPTEAQWEYCCRAGSQGRFFFGDSNRDLADHAWYSTNAGMKTHKVGDRTANRWGLHDLHGNAWEWCADYSGFDYYRKGPKQDPLGPGSGDTRVARGGGFHSGVADCRSALRHGDPPTRRAVDVGFRVVLQR